MMEEPSIMRTAEISSLNTTKVWTFCGCVCIVRSRMGWSTVHYLQCYGLDQYRFIIVHVCPRRSHHVFISMNLDVANDEHLCKGYCWLFVYISAVHIYKLQQVKLMEGVPQKLLEYTNINMSVVLQYLELSIYNLWHMINYHLSIL